MSVREDEIRERFAREVEQVRGAGGFAPTTDDLRALGDELAYVALGESARLGEDDPPESWALDLEMQIAVFWEARHEGDPEFGISAVQIRNALRSAVRELRELRREAA